MLVLGGPPLSVHNILQHLWEEEDSLVTIYTTSRETKLF